MLVTVSQPVEEAVDAIRSAWDRGEAVAPVAPGEEQRAAALGLDLPVDGEVAAVVTTSGTAGEPRGVELTWTGLHAMAAAFPGRPHDRWLLCLPVHHVAGLAVVARAWATGLPIVFEGEPGGTLASMVPTQVHRRLGSGNDLSQFRHVLVGGGPVPDDVRALRNVTATYGMTETWGGIVHDGRALPGVEVAVSGPDQEILVRTPTIMRGYRLDPEGTAAAFTADGWFRTGDAGRWAPDGRLEVVDRLRDLVITGGINVSPAEVEAVLARHPAVADVCVAGMPDDEWGERVVAYVVPAPAVSATPTVEDLRAFARPHLAAPKLPKEVVVVDRIPRTAGGKPLRRLLRDNPRPGSS